MLAGVKIQLMRLFAVNKCAGGDHLTEQHGSIGVQMAAMAIGPRHHRGNGNQFLLWWRLAWGKQTKGGVSMDRMKSVELRV